MEKISTHIEWKEAVITSTGLKNEPNTEQIAAMKLLANKIFEPLRLHINSPIKINSFFRSLEVNKAVGGSKTSQHLKGEAIDIQSTGKVSNGYIFQWIKNNLEFDQLIWEKGNDNNPAWVHVSYKKAGNRKQVIINK